MAKPLLEKRRTVYDQHRVKPARGEEGLIAIGRCSAKKRPARGCGPTINQKELSPRYTRKCEIIVMSESRLFLYENPPLLVKQCSEKIASADLLGMEEV